MDTLNKKGGEIPFSFLSPKSKNQIAKSTIKRKPARTSERIPVDILQNNMI